MKHSRKSWRKRRRRWRSKWSFKLLIVEMGVIKMEDIIAEETVSETVENLNQDFTERSVSQ